VTLAFDTIMRREVSPSVSPSGTLSSWASRSKRGKVTANCASEAPADFGLDQVAAGQQPAATA
jgi:hypothetical protein